MLRLEREQLNKSTQQEADASTEDDQHVNEEEDDDDDASEKDQEEDDNDDDESEDNQDEVDEEYTGKDSKAKSKASRGGGKSVSSGTPSARRGRGRPPKVCQMPPAPPAGRGRGRSRPSTDDEGAGARKAKQRAIVATSSRGALRGTARGGRGRGRSKGKQMPVMPDSEDEQLTDSEQKSNDVDAAKSEDGRSPNSSTRINNNSPHMIHSDRSLSPSKPFQDSDDDELPSLVPEGGYCTNIGKNCSNKSCQINGNPLTDVAIHFFSPNIPVVMAGKLKNVDNILRKLQLGARWKLRDVIVVPAVAA